jgi:8-oxo-dGTP pyrophosphatase MutT (NUDIX family)
MPQNSWTLLKSRPIAEYDVISLREDSYRFEPSGAEAPFVVCESDDWVLVIPITSDGQVVFIRQYRHGVQQVVMEIPGGMMDGKETPEATAGRELREETGYVSDRLRYLGSLLPNPALNTASCHVVVAQDCRRVGSPKLDPLERIEVLSRPLASVPEMIRSGQLSHCQVIAAFSLMESIQRRKDNLGQ